MAILENWSYKEIDNFYNRVRALLDNASPATLPDSYIDIQEKAPYAELVAKVRVRNWRELSEPQFAIFESAIVYRTASLFESLVSSNSIRKKELPTITLEYFSRSKINFNGLSLSQLSDLLLNELSEDVGTDFIGFEVTN